MGAVVGSNLRQNQLYCTKLDPIFAGASWICNHGGLSRAVGKRTPFCSYLRQRWWSSPSYTCEFCCTGCCDWSV